MKNYTIIKHSTSNRFHLYKPNSKSGITLNNRSLEIILKKYMIAQDNKELLIQKGFHVFKLIEKFPT